MPTPEPSSVTNTTLLAVNVGCHQMRFLILNAPTPSNLSVYIKDLKHNGVQSLVRVCAPTYKEDLVVAHGIKLYVCITNLYQYSYSVFFFFFFKKRNIKERIKTG